MSVFTKAAFRCKNCGHIEGPEHAGENEVPHACSVCGAGIIHNPRAHELAQELCKPDLPVDRRVAIANEIAKLARSGDQDKHAEPDNWEVLADVGIDRIIELGLATHAQVAEHENPINYVAKHTGLKVKKGQVTRADGSKPMTVGVGAEEKRI